MRFPRPIAMAVAIAAIWPLASTVHASTNVIGMLSGMQADSWMKLNTNNFLDIVPPEELRGGAASGYTGRPGSVIYAWSSFAWDSKRSELLIYGGGHANYAGNEMYKWSASTQQWSLASLPSQMVPIPGVNTATPNWVPVDGAMNGPSSAHTYDNNAYLPTVDRFVTLGGAPFNSGGTFALPVNSTTSRATGPYFFDPSRADPNKVGGTDGSGVAPGSIGGQMWQNRDLHAQGIGALSFVEGTSATAVEGGKDVLYFSARSGGTIFTDLYRLTINDVANPAADTLQKVGVYANPALNPAIAPLAYGSASYDPTSRLYVAMGGGAQPFMAWDMDIASASNNPAYGINPTIIGGGTLPTDRFHASGIEFDPVRGEWLVWTGGGTVWALTAPTAGTIAGQWTLRQIADGATFAQGLAPAERETTGVLGKWHYASDLDAFVALEDNDRGNVWIYKPANWVNPIAVPEPSSWLLMMAGGLLVGFAARRRGHQPISA